MHRKSVSSCHFFAFQLVLDLSFQTGIFSFKTQLADYQLLHELLRVEPERTTFGLFQTLSKLWGIQAILIGSAY